MILKNEILLHSKQTSIAPNIIEKDYAIGWILMGIAHHKELCDNFVFKGGTCLKKCYFNSYRMSEDLDFTLKSQSSLNDKFLTSSFLQVSKWVYDACGLVIPENKNYYCSILIKTLE